MTASKLESPTPTSPWRSTGTWLFLFASLYLVYSAMLAFWGPQDVADAFGPNPSHSSNLFIQLYAVRTVFLGVYGLILLFQCDLRAAARFLFVATLIPIGDAIVIAQTAGSVSAIVKNGVIA